jgi:hypothetical protein
MKLCGRSFATATGKVGAYDAERDDEYDHVFCGFPRGHSGVHVAMIWFFDEDSGSGQPGKNGGEGTGLAGSLGLTSPPSPAPAAHEREIAACLSA